MREVSFGVSYEIHGSVFDSSGLTPAKRPSDGSDGNAKRARYSSFGTDDEIQRNVREDHLAGRILSSDLANDIGNSHCPYTSPLPFLYFTRSRSHFLQHRLQNSSDI